MFENIEKFMLPCTTKSATGHECPGCGIQRSIVELMQGNIIESVILYPALPTLIFMMIYAILHIKFDFKHGAKVILISFIVNIVIIIVNYLIKIL